MNFLGKMALNTGTYDDAVAQYQKMLLANQLQEQSVKSGQNSLDSDSVAGSIIAKLLQGQGAAPPPGMPQGTPTGQMPGGPPQMTSQPGAMPPGMPPGGQPMPGMAPGGPPPMPGMPPGGPAPMGPSAAPPGGPGGPGGGMPPGILGAPGPAPGTPPGGDRNQLLGQLLQQQLMSGKNPAAIMGAAKQIMSTMQPQDRWALAAQLGLLRADTSMATTGERVGAENHRTDTGNEGRADDRSIKLAKTNYDNATRTLDAAIGAGMKEDKLKPYQDAVTAAQMAMGETGGSEGVKKPAATGPAPAAGKSAPLPTGMEIQLDGATVKDNQGNIWMKQGNTLIPAS